MAEAAAAAAVAPQVVGNAFVQQYYHILHHSPALVHRFYQDISKLGRPEDDGSLSYTTTMNAINEKILSLNYGDYRAEIKSVDAQESHSGGVQVLVTGYLTGKDNLIRNFSQCFFLAPQDRGYFVLNDIFRYVESSNQPDGEKVLVDDVVVDTVTQEESLVPPAVEENHVSNESNGDVPAVDEVTEVQVLNPPQNGVVSAVEEEVKKVPEVVEEVKVPEVPEVVESDSKVEEVQKKSYASIVMHSKEKPAPLSSPAPVPKKSPQKSQEQQSIPPPASETDGQIPFSGASDNGNTQEGEVGYSIYIKGLPMTATVAMLENVFKKFGQIRSGGIQVRSNRQQGFCFGFVEFEVPSAVEKALEASPVEIGGKETVVEEKRSTYSRVNRGRFLQGRGGGSGGFRNEGIRGGRGGYGGGVGGGRAGYYRGDSNGRGEFNNRGGGANKGRPSSRGGDGYQRADSNGGGGRLNNHRTGGGDGMANGIAKATAPRISATA